MQQLQKLFIMASLATATTLSALTFEYPSLYKDPRVMGMGGANVAVGGEAHALFSNPAGLSRLKILEGVELDILNINVAFSQNTLDLLDELDAANTDSQTLAVLEKFQGENNHLTLNNFSSLSYKGSALAWSVGVLAGTQFNFQTHALGSSSGLLDVNAYVLAGLVTGFSYDFTEKLHVGFGAKILEGKSMTAALTLTEVLNLTDDSTDSAQYLEDKYMKDFETTSYDVGIIYDLDNLLPLGSYLHPSLGISVMDIGETKLGDYGTIPTTLNVGMSFRPDFPILSNWLLAVDYIDVTNAYDEKYDADIGKRVRVGAKASLIHNSLLQLTGSTGIYNESPTFGAELRISLLTVNYSNYAEAIGAYASQQLDRRHHLSIAIGW